MDNSVPSPNMPREDNQFIPLFRTCLTLFRAHWKWFLLSVAVCLLFGFLYQQKQARVFQRQAVMLIEDADPSGSSSMGGSRKSRSNMSALMELNGISVGDNLKNEIFILTSQRLMGRVVDTLRLDVDYTVRQAMHEVTLYRDRPFEIAFAEPAKFPTNFKVRINDNRTFTLYDFQVSAPDADEAGEAEKVTLRPGESKHTPAGVLSILPNKGLRKVSTNKTVAISHIPRKMAAAIYCGRISASEFDKESSLIVLSCQDVNADRAEDIIRETYEAYKQDVVDNKNRVAFSTANFIDERIRLIGEDLSGIENRMANFKRNNQLIDFQQNAQAYIAESGTARQQTLELETQVAVARYLTEFLQDRSKTKETVPMLALPNAGFSQLVGEYNKLMIDRNRMEDNSSENSPVVRDLDNQLASMRSSLLSSISSYVASMELQLNRAKSNEAALSGRMGNVPEKEKEGLDIQRQQELKSALYTYLLNKREEVTLQMAINEANVRLVEDPLGSSAPISPRKSVILAISFLLGIIIPAGVLWLKNMFDVTVSCRKDIETVTNIPIVGEIPHWQNADERTAVLIKSEEMDAPIVEAFRVLRYGLNFMRHSAKVFMVTSATPGQGKSFISSNIAYILGTTGKRVLFIDADIRKRTASKALGNTSCGLTGLLADDDNSMELSDAVVTDGIDKNVDLLPAGKLPPNPSELLMSDNLDKIIDEAKAVYDYIVIDATPTLFVADAGIVNRVADITVFVIRVGVQEREFLPDLEQMYQSKKFRNLCIAVNDADCKKGYRYGYGFGYGYGPSFTSSKKRGLFGKK